MADLEGYAPVDPSAPTFSEWNTEPDGSGDSYDRGAELVVTENITLYAQWAVYAPRPKEDIVITMERESFYYSQMFLLDRVLDESPEWGDTYSITFKLKSNTETNRGIIISLGDASKEPWLALAVPDVLDATQLRELMKPISADIVTEYTLIATAQEKTGEINSVRFTMEVPATLTISDFNVEKTGSAEKVQLLDVTANGSIGTKTTQLILAFDKPVDFLRNEYAIHYISYLMLNTSKPLGLNPLSRQSISKSDSTGTIWTLNVSLNLTYFEGGRNNDLPDPTVEMSVCVKDAGFSGTKLVTIYSGKRPEEPPSPSTFVSLTQNGSSISTTTRLTLTFSNQITGLTADDITLSGVSVSKGTLSGPTQSGGNYVYTLPISDVTASGTLRAFVSKTGYDITDSARTTSIYYRTFISTPIAPVYPTYTGFIGRGYDVVNKPYYLSSEVTTAYALNMPKLVYEGKLKKDTKGVKEYDTTYFIGQTLSEYAKSFSTKTSVGASAGFFSASASFGYSSTNSVSSSKSFAKSSTYIITEKHYIDMSSMTLATIRNNYLHDTFKSYLMDNSVTPAWLFTNYGTHIFFVANVGGRLDMDFELTNTARETSSDIAIKIQASYAFVSGQNDTQYGETAREVERNSSFHAIAYGGSYNGVSFLSFDRAKDTYQNWVNSFDTTNNLSLVRGGGFERALEMVPIWDLIDTSTAAGRTRSLALQTEYNRMVDANNNMIMGLQQASTGRYIAGVFMGAGNSTATALTNLESQQSLKEMHPVQPGDLNHGAGGSVLYLGYTYTDSDSEASVRDIKAVSSSSGNPSNTTTINGMTYTRFGYDANKGANGPYIWLYYTRDTRAGLPLKSIIVEHNGNTYGGKSGIGWERVKWNTTGNPDADMNKGVGGSTVYIWVQRQIN